MHRPSRIAGAVAGLVAGAAALGIAELLAGFVTGVPSPVVAIGSLVIALQPPGAEQALVGLLGSADKLVLNLAVLVVALAISAGLGVLARSGGTAAAPDPGRFRLAVGGFAIVALVALLASIGDPLVVPIYAIGTLILAVIVAWQTLAILLRLAAGPTGEAVAEMPDWSRRRFLGTSIGVSAGAIAAGAAGRVLLGNRAEPAAALPPIPAPASTAPPIPSGATIDTPGISPLVTPNASFYRIDTQLLTPHLNAATWKLTVTGMVDRELSFTYDELVAMPLQDEYVTLQCVSNEVGGNLVGNARWTGVRLLDVLNAAGVQSGASQVVGRAYDGFTVGFPTELLTPENPGLIVVGMNGARLPAAHGFPARLIVPGLYGYVSATKWLTNIEMTTWDAFDAYWVKLGWSKKGPIKTTSRIDTPKFHAALDPGTVPVAGVAWAPERGISKVEVSVDDGPWEPARLATEISNATWVQWIYPWKATSGQHRISCRATDGTGALQVATDHEPPPNGATGYHYIYVEVS